MLIYYLWWGQCLMTLFLYTNVGSYGKLKYNKMVVKGEYLQEVLSNCFKTFDPSEIFSWK